MLQEFFPVLEGVPMGDLWVLLTWGLLIMSVWMFGLWLLHLKLQNASVLRVGWASGLVFLGVFDAFKAEGYGPRRFLIGTMVLLWGARLVWHLVSDRLLGGKSEDPRYAIFRERWARYPGIAMFINFAGQVGLAVFLSVPFALMGMDPLQKITGFEWIGFCLWVIAVWGEYAADAQLKHFKADPGNQGRVCEDGLWYHSRHPNYFFEWLVWVAFFVAALETSYGAWTIFCPILMLYLLKIRGIRATEEHALQSRGEEYADYQKTTSPFLPWPKRSPETPE